MQKNSILVVGATGLVGSAFLRLALADPDGGAVHTLVRRPSGMQDVKLDEHVADTEQWPGLIADLKPSTVFCGLGTTIRQAGSQAAFRAVDLELVVSTAQASRDAGTGHFVVISSTMADAKAGSFYLRTKGAMEAALTAMAFERLDILRPGLLRGRRTGRTRFGESLALAASPVLDRLLHGGLRKYRSIRAADVAACAYKLTARTQPGLFVHDNDQMLEVVAGY